MKYLITLVLLMCSFSTQAQQPKVYDLASVIDALILTETDGYSRPGDNGASIGYLQIQTIMVDRVNEILGYRHFKYEDREDLAKSRQMCTVYLVEMLRLIKRRTGSVPSYERLAETWNAGNSVARRPLYAARFRQRLRL